MSEYLRKYRIIFVFFFLFFFFFFCPFAAVCLFGFCCCCCHYCCCYFMLVSCVCFLLLLLLFFFVFFVVVFFFFLFCFFLFFFYCCCCNRILSLIHTNRSRLLILQRNLRDHKYMFLNYIKRMSLFQSNLYRSHRLHQVLELKTIQLGEKGYIFKTTVSKMFWLPSGKGPVLKEKNFLPIGTQTGSHKSHLTCKNGGKLPSASVPLSHVKYYETNGYVQTPKA